jgi:hypothetical protein
VLTLAGVGVSGAALLADDDGDGDYCVALDTQARSDVPVIVFLGTNATPNGAARLQADIEARDDIVGEVDYVDEEEAYAEAMELFADEPTMQDLLDPEHLPSSLRFVVEDRAAVGALRDSFENWADRMLRPQIETPVHSGADVRKLAEAVVDEVWGDGRIPLELDRFGHWVGPETAEGLRATAPGEVADEIDLVLDVLTDDDGVIEQRHVEAMEVILRDAEARCD